MSIRTLTTTFALLCLTLSVSSTFAQDLSVQTEFSAQQILGRQQLNEVRYHVEQATAEYYELDRAVGEYNNAYHQTGDYGYYQAALDYARARDEVADLVNDAQARLARPTLITLIDDPNGQYEHLATIPWNMSALEYLQANPHLIGQRVAVRTNVGGGGNSSVRPNPRPSTRPGRGAVPVRPNNPNIPSFDGLTGPVGGIYGID